MRYCKRCLYPENHPLKITFDEQGVCSGCRVHEEKDELDWGERNGRLQKIFDEFRIKTRPINDCIIPVSGARDSHFIVHVVKNIFKMRPLLVYYNKQYNTKMGIRNLDYLKSLLGCDILNLTVSPERTKRITRESIKQLGSMYWHCLAGQTVFPVNMAVKFRIPLIVWGAHQGCDQVGMFSHLDEVEMTRKYRKDHDLMGMEAEDLAASADEISLNDMEPYVYPHDKELEAVGVRGIYLNNYIRWDSKAQHELMIEKYGYETMRQQRTFDTYNDVDCFHYSGIHDYIKFLKWGYGKVNDHASREIRLKRMTRSEGIEMVKKYQDVYPEDLPLFIKWCGMQESEFFANINRFRDPKIWKKSNGEWKLQDSVIHHLNDDGVETSSLGKKEDCDFWLRRSREPEYNENDYILIGRGWVDKK